jgi:tripartite-type tricarboxylate transporter receptor subunit TctC
LVPFAAGGANDIAARLVGEALSHKLQTPIVIENRPGAGSVLGTEFVARAKPDGYTLLLSGLSASALNSTVHKVLPYDPRTDFCL